MKIGNLNLTGRLVAAPLAGVSSRPFRLLARHSGAALVFTEMISSQGLVRDQAKSWTMAGFQADERPLGVQIFGADPDSMHLSAARLVDRLRPDVIDINFGCPVRKVVCHNGGAAVLKDLMLTEEIIRATVEGAGNTPVTVKMRTGWDDTQAVFKSVGLIAEQAGAAAVTLHGRSRARGFAGRADWSAIRELKAAIGIPVIGNGDVCTPQDAARMLDETGCDFIMIGRAAMADPFVFRQINAYLNTGNLLLPPSIEEKIAVARHHALLMVEEFGEKKGVLRMRRHLSCYVRGFRGASVLRPALFQAETLADIDAIFAGYLSSQSRISDTSSAA